MGRRLAGVVAGLAALSVVVTWAAPGPVGPDPQTVQVEDRQPEDGETPRFHLPNCFETVVEAPLPGDAPRVLQGRDPLQITLSAGDPIYVGHPQSGRPQIGQRYRVARDVGTVRHPATGEELGIVRSIRGVARAVEVGVARSLIRVESSCREIEPGDRLVPLEEITLPEVGELPVFEANRLVEPRVGDGTVILGSLVSVPEPGAEDGSMTTVERQGHAIGEVLSVDRGAADGWRRGDLVTLYRPGEQYRTAESGSRVPQIVGRAFVFAVRDSSSSLLITDALEPIAVGDRARTLAR